MSPSGGEAAITDSIAATMRRYAGVLNALPPRSRVDNALVKAIARAHRWKRMIESGRLASLTELADAEKINRAYLYRILRLTLLAPDVVEAIVDGRAGGEVGGGDGGGAGGVG